MMMMMMMMMMIIVIVVVISIFFLSRFPYFELDILDLIILLLLY